MSTGVLTPSERDPPVALPQSEPPAGQPLSDTEAGALRQQVDPRRVRCEPRGCELWRRQRADVWGLETVDDLVVILEPGRLVALDGDGELRWTARVDDLLPETSAPSRQAAVGRSQHLWSAAGGLVVAGLGRLAFLDGDGARRWTVAGMGSVFPDDVLTSDMIVMYEAHGSGGLRTVVIDPSDGGILFDGRSVGVLYADRDHVVTTTTTGSMEVHDLTGDGRRPWDLQLWRELPDDSSVPTKATLADVHHITPSTVVVATYGDDARLEVLDLATGALLWSRPVPQEAGIVAGDRWIAMPDATPGYVLLDAATGQQVAASDREVVSDFVTVGDHEVTVMASAEPGAGSRAGSAELVALDRDAGVVWSIHLGEDDAWRCCTAVRAGQELVVIASGEGERLRVDASTGAVLEAWSDTRNGTGYFLRRWYAADGSRIQAANDGVTIESDDSSVAILPNDVWPETEGPWVVGNADELLGVRLMPGR